MDKLLTIAIPTYNMEKYIARCLDSILISDDLDKLQVIVVNDGSRDRSSEIAHNYADRYPCSISVIDKSNGNYGSCVNAALQAAVGKYIKILDSDDYFDNNNLRQLIERLKKCDSDAVLTNHTIITPTGKHYWKHNYADGQCIMLQDECPSYFPMHSIIYRTALLKKMCYKQSEGISYTDQEWIFYPMLKADQMVYIDLDLYQYCMDREGQTMDPKVFAKGLPMLYAILYRALAYCKENALDNVPARAKYCEMQLFKQAETIYRQELVFNAGISGMLTALDLKISETDSDLYRKLDDLRIGFCKYVKRFRATGQGMSAIDKRTLSIQCKIINLLAAFRNRIK